ncbi:MAG: RagB/SusD family nutrient uptake outer membrane protein [Candidatus Symbiothrix sp.]|jgi:hypothetical protein|nr:RagB/SusD family nutrient uptake outer membrane protein [Candidatus Symbiothrix sp.]
MKNKYIYILCTIITLFASCNDYLDVDPTQRAQLKTPEDVSKLLVTAYPKASYVQFMEIMSDNVGDNSKWIRTDILGLVERPLTQNFWWENVDDVEQDTPTNYWNSCYEAIAAANTAIRFIEESADPENYSAQLGEALLCRAYAHFMLSVFFAKPYDPATADSDLGVPYVDAPETVVFADYHRETVAKTYELIEADLLKGLPLIDDASYSSYKYHFNKMAANAFAGRFFLFKHDWEKVIKYTSVTLGTSEASLLRDWNGSAGYNTLGPKELTAIYTNYQEPANLLMQEETSWYAFSTYYRYILLKDINNDIYGSSQSKNATGGRFVATPNLSYQSGVNEVMIPKFKEWQKFTSINSQSYYAYIMHPLFTAEEALLNRAEAYAMQGNTEGVCHDLNIYFSKRISNYNAVTHNVTGEKINTFAKTLPDILSPIGYTLTEGDQLNQVKVVVDTKRKEFIHEGNRWFDVKRFNIEVTHTSYDKSRTETLGKNDLRRELQIPEEAQQFGIAPNPR